jgi:hypothetical protein
VLCMLLLFITVYSLNNGVPHIAEMRSISIHEEKRSPRLGLILPFLPFYSIWGMMMMMMSFICYAEYSTVTNA